ncbi:MAG: hypothetical protein GY698_04645 [Actinomycetia bacterium]|nr:hypothetical protein [Actinomycetes bacterium]
MPPVVFLDVDGVVSALSSRHAFGDGRKLVLDGFSLTLSRRLGARLASLSADIVWLTTWGQKANEVGCRVGLPELPVAALPPVGGAADGAWKFEAVREYSSTAGRPWVWIDDNAISRQAEVWAEAQQFRSLLVRPAANRGLSPEEMDSIEDWILEAS